MTSMPDSNIPIFLDVDTGHDDSFAILLAAFHPKAHLVGISTVHGNAPLDHTTYNTLAVLEAFGRTDVPVFAGAAQPLSREACHAEGIHGVTGLDGTDLLPHPSRQAINLPQDEMLDHVERLLMQQPPNTLWVVATGALTNIYNLFARHPHLVDHIKGLSIMGGAVGGGFTDAHLGTVSGGHGERFGNWTPYAEFNIYCDPEAAQGIFTNSQLARKTTLITLDLTHKCLATPAIQQQLLSGARSQPEDTITTTTTSTNLRNPHLRQMMNDLLVFFADTYNTIFGLPAPPLHDPLAVLAVLEPSLFTDDRGLYFRVTVQKEGERYDSATNRFNELGRTRVEKSFDAGVRVPTGVDLVAFWQVIDDALDAAAR